MLVESQLIDCLHDGEHTRLNTILIILCVRIQTPKTVEEIKRLGRNAGLPEILRWNVSDILRKAPGFAIKLPEGWLITSKGKKRVAFNLPYKEHRIVKTVEDLRSMCSKIKDKSTLDFLTEALACFESGLYRAAVILSWVGAISLLQNHIISTSLINFNAEALRRDARWKNARMRDDLGRMKEADFLDVIGSSPR